MTVIYNKIYTVSKNRCFDGQFKKKSNGILRCLTLTEKFRRPLLRIYEFNIKNTFSNSKLDVSVKTCLLVLTRGGNNMFKYMFIRKGCTLI